MKENMLYEIIRKPQAKLKKYINYKLKQFGYAPINKDGFLYAEGELPVLLVAHLDTVHKENVKHICVSEDGVIMSPQGIGGDDRCGVYMIMELVKQLKCHVLFCEDEEIGGVGAAKFVKSKIRPAVNYIIEFDRKGSDDAVFYDCDNQEFTDFILDFGYNFAFGSFSDIDVIAPALGVAAVNLSSGYYKAHLENEYIKLEDVKKNISRAAKIITTPTNLFIYVEAERYRYYDFWHKTYDYYTDLYKDYADLDCLTVDAMAVDFATSYLRSDFGEYVEVSWNEVYIDSAGTVYQYDEEYGAFIELDGFCAYDFNGLQLRFDEEKVEEIEVVYYALDEESQVITEQHMENYI